MVILYLETNFLINLALKQDSKAEALLGKAARDRSLRLAIPQVCIMEAFAAIRRRVQERVSLQRRIETEITQLNRSPTSSIASRLRDELTQSSITNEEYINAILDSFQEATNRLVSLGELISVNQQSVERSFDEALIKSKLERLVLPDNFIICSILENVGAYPSDVKVVLSGNHKEFGAESVQRAFRAAGIQKYFTDSKKFLDWYESLPK